MLKVGPGSTVVEMSSELEVQLTEDEQDRVVQMGRGKTNFQNRSWLRNLAQSRA